MIFMGLGYRLKSLREENNLTQLDVSEKLCISRQSISKWENDKGYPDIDNLIELSKLFNISVDELLKEKNEHYSIPKRKDLDSSTYKQIDEWLFLLVLAILLCLISPLGMLLLPVVVYRNKSNQQFHKTINIACILCLTINLYSAFVLIGDYFHSNQSSVVEYTTSTE